MRNKLIVVAAVSGLALTTALAQSQQSPLTAPPRAEFNAAQNPTGKATLVNRQSQDQLVASQFKGTDVIGSDGQKIGDVNDILFDKNGSIAAYVIGVGGFLGIGSKDVGVTPASFQVVTGDNGRIDKLRLAMTMDELKQAVAFEYYSPPAPSPGVAGIPPATRVRPGPATQ